MSEYCCPECGGGFPEAELRTDTYGRPDDVACPWCGNPLYDYE